MIDDDDLTAAEKAEQDPSDYKTVRVGVRGYYEAREQKKANGRTWAEQIVRPDDGETGDGVEVDTEALAAQLADVIDYPDAQDTDTIARRLDSLDSIESRIGSIERTLEDLQR